MTFVPFDATPQEAGQWAVLRPGVPKSMRPMLVTWLWQSFKLYRQPWTNISALRETENALDVDFNLNDEYTGSVDERQFRGLLSNVDDRDLLRIADYRLYEGEGSHHSLSELLQKGRSQYHVVETTETGRLRHRLSSKLPEGVQDAAQSIADSTTTAGQLLRKALENVYEVNPQDSAAYLYAVRAVETAAFKALGITGLNATLGNAIRAIEAKDARWRLPFLREHSQYPSKDLLVGMLKSLYKGQRDRHGSEAYSDVTHDEAEGAVLLAVTLVGWFSRGLVVERDPAKHDA